MIVLVANLGSTSFKYKLYDMAQNERVLAVGAADRIGQGDSAWEVEIPDGPSREGVSNLNDHGQAIELHLKQLNELGAITSDTSGGGGIEAIGFKAVHGGPIRGAVRVDEQVLKTMAEFSDVAPQHNPPYIAAMRSFAEKLPQVAQVAAFETAFHQTIAPAQQVYGIPHEWTNGLGIRRYGFHGASHRYIAVRSAEILPDCRKIISLHLGGSCSITAIKDGKSVANSFGMTAQSGVFHASRVGDFDTFALLKLLKSGLDIDAIFNTLGKEAGLKGLSGVSADMREVEDAAAAGNAQAQLALDAFVESCRHYVGAYLAQLNGADLIVFTGGVGQFGKEVRKQILANMDFAGIVLNDKANAETTGKDERPIHDSQGGASPTQVWVIPTNEELIVARQTVDTLQAVNQ